jgi:putative ATP-dependent endonuclease of the OLD family
VRIHKIRISNFRNFHSLDLSLDKHAVILGENKIGKSNLLYALRLVLDPSISDTARQLREEDFWDGLPRPLSASDRITVSVDLKEFEGNENQLALLADYLVSAEPMIARLTYVLQRVPGSERADDFEFAIYGGDRPENFVRGDVRRRMPLDVLPALRDAESDLANWRRSPLRSLLDKATAGISEGDLDRIEEEITTARDSITDLHPIKNLCESVTKRLTTMMGSHQAVDFLLGFSPTDINRMMRSLRPLIDEGRRGIAEASLGSANLIYLALRSLEIEHLVEDGSRDHTFLGIEEPEAHLHPNLQRLTFRNFFNTDLEAGSTNILLTTHSPHIASVAPLRSLVVLRKSPDLQSTEGVSTADVQLDLADVADLERYLDVTRAEIIFSRGVLLVEGEAEEFLVPKLADLNGLNLDELGIAVCSVAGTNFLPYLKFLGNAGLQIPVAILTDYDPADEGRSLGINRAKWLLESANIDTESQDIPGLAAKHGIFLNDYTLEVDLFRSGRHKSITNTLISLGRSNAAKERAKVWQNSPIQLDVDRFLEDINVIGKGRFAQRLANVISGETCPAYIKNALRYLADRVR